MLDISIDSSVLFIEEPALGCWSAGLLTIMDEQSISVISYAALRVGARIDYVLLYCMHCCRSLWSSEVRLCLKALLYSML